jgi:hypothetical protein
VQFAAGEGRLEDVGRVGGALVDEDDQLACVLTDLLDDAVHADHHDLDW